ncbi:hypothetical protein PV327_000938 [Microctonus hyperodae]|uniref:Uncharacterized protein n=2 Tax=Microctonus hyperodae TaxID=165561 RepID=A0AA39L2P4_MICHY|nr:hypothetical protein PV327_000938 [Microctonus hyperodae]
MQKILKTMMFLKNNIRLNFPFIVFLSLSLIFCLMFKYIYISIILCNLAFGLNWMKIQRESVKQQDVIVITGCDSGLGFSLALHCHQHLNLQVIAGTHKCNGQGTKELMKIGIAVHQLDITDKESIKTFVQWTNDHLKTNNLTLRSVVNNAGTMVFGEFEWQTDVLIHHQFNVNLLGTWNFTREFLPLIRKYQTRLIIVTSHCAKEPLPGVAVYSATKAGLTAWASALRMELKKFGVDVVKFIPGSFIQNSNILARQETHFKLMESAMLPEAKQLYSDYFRRYTNYLSGLSREVPPEKIKNPRLYEIFEDALLERYPSSTYKCEPWRYTFYHILFKITPNYIHDWLIEKFIQMPPWKGNNNYTSE